MKHLQDVEEMQADEDVFIYIRGIRKVGHGFISCVLRKTVAETGKRCFMALKTTKFKIGNMKCKTENHEI